MTPAYFPSHKPIYDKAYLTFSIETTELRPALPFYPHSISKFPLLPHPTSHHPSLKWARTISTASPRMTFVVFDDGNCGVIQF